MKCRRPPLSFAPLGKTPAQVQANVAVLGANLDAHQAAATVDVLYNVSGLDGPRETWPSRATTELVDDAKASPRDENLESLGAYWASKR
jgi:hypothetical protein